MEKMFNIDNTNEKKPEKSPEKKYDIYQKQMQTEVTREDARVVIKEYKWFTK